MATGDSNNIHEAPGLGTRKEGYANEFLRGNENIEVVRITLDSAAVDSGNSPTTTLRKGLVLAEITATGKYKAYVSGGAGGQGTAKGILMATRSTLNRACTAEDTFATMLVRGLVDDTKLHGIDATSKTALNDNILFTSDY